MVEQAIQALKVEAVARGPYIAKNSVVHVLAVASNCWQYSKRSTDVVCVMGAFRDALRTAHEKLASKNDFLRMNGEPPQQVNVAQLKDALRNAAVAALAQQEQSSEQKVEWLEDACEFVLRAETANLPSSPVAEKVEANPLAAFR